MQGRLERFLFKNLTGRVRSEDVPDSFNPFWALSIARGARGAGEADRFFSYALSTALVGSVLLPLGFVVYALSMSGDGYSIRIRWEDGWRGQSTFLLCVSLLLSSMAAFDAVAGYFSMISRGEIWLLLLTGMSPARIISGCVSVAFGQFALIAILSSPGLLFLGLHIDANPLLIIPLVMWTLAVGFLAIASLVLLASFPVSALPCIMGSGFLLLTLCPCAHLLLSCCPLGDAFARTGYSGLFLNAASGMAIAACFALFLGSLAVAMLNSLRPNSFVLVRGAILIGSALFPPIFLIHPKTWGFLNLDSGFFLLPILLPFTLLVVTTFFLPMPFEKRPPNGRHVCDPFKSGWMPGFLFSNSCGSIFIWFSLCLGALIFWEDMFCRGTWWEGISLSAFCAATVGAVVMGDFILMRIFGVERMVSSWVSATVAWALVLVLYVLSAMPFLPAWLKAVLYGVNVGNIVFRDQPSTLTLCFSSTVAFLLLGYGVIDCRRQMRLEAGEA